MSHAASGTFEPDMGAAQGFRARCRREKSRWSFFEVAAMVAGFVIFWPLGRVAHFLKLKNGEIWPGAASGQSPAAPWKMPSIGSWSGRSCGFASSGNAAFDDYKRTQLAKLEEERRKLDEEQKAFREHLANLRKAKDQEEFDRFMSQRKAPPPAPEPPAT